MMDGVQPCDGISPKSISSSFCAFTQLVKSATIKAPLPPLRPFFFLPIATTKEKNNHPRAPSFLSFSAGSFPPGGIESKSGDAVDVPSPRLLATELFREPFRVQAYFLFFLKAPIPPAHGSHCDRITLAFLSFPFFNGKAPEGLFFFFALNFFSFRWLAAESIAPHFFFSALYLLMLIQDGRPGALFPPHHFLFSRPLGSRMTTWANPTPSFFHGPSP